MCFFLFRDSASCSKRASGPSRACSGFSCASSRTGSLGVYPSEGGGDFRATCSDCDVNSLQTWKGPDRKGPEGDGGNGQRAPGQPPEGGCTA